MIELENGYVIVQTSSLNWTLRQKYMGIRNGVDCECMRTISHHSSVEDALKGFIKLFPSLSDAKQTENLGTVFKAI